MAVLYGSTRSADYSGRNQRVGALVVELGTCSSSPMNLAHSRIAGELMLNIVFLQPVLELRVVFKDLAFEHLLQD